jgi:hypothetical protein
MNAAGASEMSERCRERTIAIANAAVIASGISTARSPPSTPPPIISTTPTAASAVAIHVRAWTGSLSSSHARMAAIMGAAACQKRTLATVV